MQYFHNPLQPTGGSTVDKDKVKALSVWSKIESALRKQCEKNQILFHAEVKRLCLVVEAGLELWDPKVNEGQDPQALFLRQLSVQMRILAHMRKMKPEVVEKCAEGANEKAQADKTRSGSDHFLDALRSHLTLSEDELLEGIGMQPLAAVLVEQQALFEELGSVFYRLHDHVPKRREDVERTLLQLLTLHSHKDKA